MYLQTLREMVLYMSKWGYNLRLEVVGTHVVSLSLDKGALR